MTIEQAVFLAVGFLLNGLTFACGVAVGISLVRKDACNDCDDDTEEDDDDEWGKPSGR